jgi:6-hydroxy-3-succinoylpyridine 3-monooxygenase
LGRRSAIYIDGFNLYYGALKDSSDKWLDLQKYFTQVRSAEMIQQIWYFTAEVTGPSGLRQQAYLDALATRPLIKTVKGVFKKKQLKCGVRSCSYSDPTSGKKFSSYEEKQTDVNIALQIVRDAYEKRYESIVLVSGDSDLVPALALAREISSPSTKITVYVPSRYPERVRATGELRAIADNVRALPLANLSKAQFPVEGRDSAGNVIYRKPNSW